MANLKMITEGVALRGSLGRLLGHWPANQFAQPSAIQFLGFKIKEFHFRKSPTIMKNLISQDIGPLEIKFLRVK